MKLTLLLLALFTTYAAYAVEEDSDEDVPESAFADTLSLDTDGRVELNGDEVVAKPTPKLFAEVEKIIPGNDGTMVFHLRPIELRQKNDDGSVKKSPMQGEAKPFVYNELWKMYDAEGGETLDPEMAMRVLIPAPASFDANTAEVKWNECDKDLPGNYIGLNCNKNRFMDDVFVAFLKQNLLKCVNVGMARVGGKPAVKTYILHDGTSGDAKHDRNSLHMAGRAVDFLVIGAIDANGNRTDFDFRKTNSPRQANSKCLPAGSPNCKFFEGFRSCWGKIHTARGCGPRSSGQPVGTIGWEEKRHVAHHLHTSMPFCPKSRGFKTTSNQ